MIKRVVRVTIISFLFIALTVILHPGAFCQQSSLLQEGINQYKQKNFAEAIDFLTRARSEDPQSTSTAFFLGLSYKQTMDYEKAYDHLKDAVTYTPRIKQAVVELANAALQLGRIEEAEKWIGVAEEDNILPAKTAFLKGLIFTEEGKNREAAGSFEKAKSLNPDISQAADIQIALSYLRDRELKKAKESFQTAITIDPQSDLAGFARQYLANVEKALEGKKPFNFTLSVFGQYDDNMILKPDDQTLAEGITNEASTVFNSSFGVTYSPTLTGQWLFKARYNVASSLHDKNVHTHDLLSNSISITPGYNFGGMALNLVTRYNHILLRGPSYKKYSGAFSTGPLMRIALKGNQMIEIFSGFTDTEYFRPALAPEEDRDSRGAKAYLSWLWLFKTDGLVNLRYQYYVQNTDGQNWDSKSHGVSANLAVPLTEKVKFQLSGQVTDQDFENVHTTFNIKREDTIYNISGGLSLACRNGMTLVAQYTRMMDDSNLAVYDYERNVYSLGMEYRF